MKSIPFLGIILVLCTALDSEARCRWQVSGKVSVLDDVFVSRGQTELRAPTGAKIHVYGSLSKNHGYAKWGITQVKSSGTYVFRGKPRFHDPISCRKKRYFKIKIAFDHREAKIGSVGHGARAFQIAHTSRRQGVKRHGRYRVSIPAVTIKSETAEPKPLKLVGSLYHRAKSAMLFTAYRRLYAFLKSSRLNPKQLVAIYPGAAVDGTHADPIGSAARFGPTWFTRSGHNYRYRESIHEVLHIWWNRKVFFPNIVSGIGNTHEFVETQDLSLYEAFAEWAAIIFLRDGDKQSVGDKLRPIDREALWSAFRDARKPSKKKGVPGPKLWPDAHTLWQRIDTRTPKFMNTFYRTETAAMNYLKLLILPDWYRFNYGRKGASGDMVRLVNPACAGVPRQLFTPKKLWREFMAWKRKGAAKAGRAGIRHFMSFLARRHSRFRPFKKLVFELGYPGSTVEASSACKATKRTRRRR